MNLTKSKHLSKSDFLIYFDSPLHLWAKVNDQLDSRKWSMHDQLVANQGYQVEALAKKFLKKKIEAQYPLGSQINFQVVVENGPFLARLDALVHDQVHDTYDIYEIKSSTRVKAKHKKGVVFQQIIAQRNFNIHKSFQVYVNRDYVRDGELDLEKFFKIRDMNPYVAKMSDDVDQARHEAWKIINRSKPPLALHCHKPDKCPCLNLCHPELPDYSVYDLSWWKQGQYQQLRQEGYLGLSDLYKEAKDLTTGEVDSIRAELELNDRQKKELRSFRKKQSIIDFPKLKKELDQIRAPVFFLDYETYNSAVPLYDGYRPYQQIVFQFSLHVLRDLAGFEDDRNYEHYDLLITDQDEPSHQLSQKLIELVGTELAEGTVVVWHSHFECGRNRELALLQPEFAQSLNDLNQRTYDLKNIFSQGIYVDYRFKGSASIKKVLPVLVPELSYDDMAIGEGTVAMTKWYELVFGGLDAVEIEDSEKTKSNLLKYCELDTWAMVKIWRKLRKLVERD